LSFTKQLRAELNTVLRSHPDLLPKNANLLIAVSGGQDSLCLAKLLLMQSEKYNWNLAIAHCDHQWRGDSRANADHVQKIAAKWGINFCLRTAEIPLKSEAWAREWRYKMLGEMAKVNNCDYVVTGHTRSDRVETLLYNLMRGSGADGLASLTWRRSLSADINLVRPLLNVSRHQTKGFCDENQIPIWEDSTNQNLDYRRNRLRLETIPYLQTHFNPQLENMIAQTSELLHGDVLYLESQASRFFEENISVIWDERSPKLQRQKLQEQPLALQRRIVRQFLSRYLIHQVNFEDVERFLNLLEAPNRSQSEPFKGNISAFVEHPWIVLYASGNS
jgi:tRNA(Ile)-lysidine synthase